MEDAERLGDYLVAIGKGLDSKNDVSYLSFILDNIVTAPYFLKTIIIFLQDLFANMLPPFPPPNLVYCV